jgi:hypothetical protein
MTHHRPGELSGHGLGLGGGQGRLDVKDVAGPDAAKCEPEVFPDAPGDGASQTVCEAGTGPDLDAGDGRQLGSSDPWGREVYLEDVGNGSPIRIMRPPPNPGNVHAIEGAS